MCNYIHNEPDNKFELIPKSGIGYKLFSIRDISGKQIISPLVCGYYDKDPLYNDIIWDTNKYNTNGGFLFFKDKIEAINHYDNWGPMVILCTIKYKKGIGSWIETKDRSFGRNTRFYACHQFRII